MAHSTRQSRRSSLDLDELAPSQFLIYNTHINSALKGEGVLKGRMFELTTWRRAGLLARLRERGYNVRTIADRLEALPEPPAPPPIGGAAWRPLTSSIEQISHFDLRHMRWHGLVPETREDGPGVTIYDGWVLRRRKGRGAASYYLAFKERTGGIGLRPLDETSALLTGFAQSFERDARPLLAERRGDALLLPNVELPPPYRATLALFSTASPEGSLVDQLGWPLAQDLFGRLGVRLTAAEE